MDVDPALRASAAPGPGVPLACRTLALDATLAPELLVTAVNNDMVLSQNLLASPSVTAKELPLRVFTNEQSAASAYNKALSEAKADVVIFAHQDVYLPASFIRHLRSALSHLSARSAPPWAVLGVFGAASDGMRLGRVWSSGLNRELGKSFTEPTPVVSLDELLLVVRRSSLVSFDDSLPGFHLYGTDIVQAALAKGLGAYVVHAPVIHNSNPAVLLGPDYWRAYRHVARRWRERLPIPTCILPLTNSPWPEIHYRAYQRWSLLFRSRPTGVRQADPAAIATRLAF